MQMRVAFETQSGDIVAYTMDESHSSTSALYLLDAKGDGSVKDSTCVSTDSYISAYGTQSQYDEATDTRLFTAQRDGRCFFFESYEYSYTYI